MEAKDKAKDSMANLQRSVQPIVEETLGLIQDLSKIASKGVAARGACRPEHAWKLGMLEAALNVDSGGLPRDSQILLASLGESTRGMAAACLALGGQLQQWLALQEALFDPPCHEGGGTSRTAGGDRGVDVRCRLAALLAQVALLAQHSCRMAPQQQAELLSGVAPALAKYATGTQAGGLRLLA